MIKGYNQDGFKPCVSYVFANCLYLVQPEFGHKVNQGQTLDSVPGETCIQNSTEILSY